MALKATVYAGIAARITGSPDMGVSEHNIPKMDDTVFDNGLSDFQSDLLWSDARTLTTGANEDLDLRGTLVDALGATTAFVEVTAILIRSRSANTTNLTVGNAAANGAALGFGATTHTWILQPGAVFLATCPKAGWPTTAGTADLLRITNAAGASATYDIIVMGRSA